LSFYGSTYCHCPVKLTELYIDNNVEPGDKYYPVVPYQLIFFCDAPGKDHKCLPESERVSPGRKLSHRKGKSLIIKNVRLPRENVRLSPGKEDLLPQRRTLMIKKGKASQKSKRAPASKGNICNKKVKASPETGRAKGKKEG
jgi:hypothetical protein